MTRQVHRIRAGALLVALSVAAAGCGSSSGSSPDTASAGGNTLEFAVVAELTGKFAPYGTQMQAGAKAAAEALNASGEYDFTLKPVFYDCQSDQAICVSQSRQAVTTDKMPLVMGPVVSLLILPSAEVTQRADVPHIVFAVLPAITDDYTNTFRWSAQNDVNNDTVVGYVKNKMQPGETVAIVHATTEFGAGGAQQQAAGLKEAGIEPVATIGHDPDQADYTPLMVQLRQKQPTYILLSDSNPADIAKLLRQSREAGLTGTWIGADAAGAISLAGDDAVDYMTVSPWFPNNEADPNSVALTKELKAAGVNDPGWIAGMAYDATKGIAEAAKAKGLSASELMEGMSSLSDMPGTAVTSWTFSPDNRRGLPEVTIANWNGTGYETVWPES